MEAERKSVKYGGGGGKFVKDRGGVQTHTGDGSSPPEM